MENTAKDFTLDELLISRMAREIKGELLAGGGTFSSQIAVLLAKKTHAPDISPFSGDFFDSNLIPTLSIREFVGFDHIKARMSWTELFELIAHKKFFLWIGPVQIDVYGNANISVIGKWDKPSTPLVGARGLPDDSVLIDQMSYHVINHSKRVFVEKVDFVCAVGNGEARNEYGLQEGAPGTVVSNLGVFDFDKESGKMRIQSIHPGVTLEQITENTGFELIIPENIPETQYPTEEEVRLIRTELDPLNIRKLEYLKGEEAQKLMFEISKKEHEIIRAMGHGNQ